MMDFVLEAWVSANIERAKARWMLGGNKPWQPGEKLKLLFAGYNGTRNMGSDVRVEEMLRQIRHIMGAERVEFDELVRISDYISIHTPLVAATHHLFNADVFRRMKPTAYLINTARGPIVDEAALARALDEKQLAGAALDVMEQEPPANSPLFGRDNVILTPHTSFYSEESLVDLQTKAAEEVLRVLTGRPARNPVNPEAARPAVS